MNWVKGFAVVTCLATPLPIVLAVRAAAAPVASPMPITSTDVNVQKIAASDADKKAKATDCSRQADAKKLHGEARRKFRDACKKA